MGPHCGLKLNPRDMALKHDYGIRRSKLADFCKIFNSPHASTLTGL
jgi:hypothetical protein